MISCNVIIIHMSDDSEAGDQPNNHERILKMEGERLFSQAQSVEDKTKEIDQKMQESGFDADSPEWRGLFKRIGSDPLQITVNDPERDSFNIDIFPEQVTFTGEPIITIEGHPSSVVALQRSFRNTNDPNSKVRY